MIHPILQNNILQMVNTIFNKLPHLDKSIWETVWIC